MIKIAKIQWYRETNLGIPCSACEEVTYEVQAWRMWINSTVIELPTGVVVCENCYADIQIEKGLPEQPF